MSTATLPAFSPAVAAAIAQAAQANGVPLPVALAIAQVESGGNPNAIGDQGRSVGLYQLSSAGEGAGMTVVARENPLANAMIALKRVGQLYKGGTISDWGDLAAAAQRPSDPSVYSQLIDATIAREPGVATTGSDPTTGAAVSAGTSSVATSAGHGIADYVIGTGKSVGSFVSGSALAILAAAIALYVIFAPDVAGTSRI